MTINQVQVLKGLSWLSPDLTLQLGKASLWHMFTCVYGSKSYFFWCLYFAKIEVCVFATESFGWSGGRELHALFGQNWKLSAPLLHLMVGLSFFCAGKCNETSFLKFCTDYHQQLVWCLKLTTTVHFCLFSEQVLSYWIQKEESFTEAPVLCSRGFL